MNGETEEKEMKSLWAKKVETAGMEPSTPLKKLVKKREICGVASDI